VTSYGWKKSLEDPCNPSLIPTALGIHQRRKCARIGFPMPLKNTAAATPIDLSEEPLTPAEVLVRFKIKFKGERQAKAKIYELTRRRGNRPPMPSHRVGKELRFYWSEIRRWQQEVQQLRAAA
jgi:hypothetical protein